MKVAVVYRVVQGWRAPVFERLSNIYNLKVFYGCDFRGTKVVSLPGPHLFPSKEMFSIPVAFKNRSGNMLLPFSPFLFFELCRFKPDVVVCEGASNFLNNIFAFAYCKIFGKPMIQWGLGEIKGKKTGKVRRLLNPVIQSIERRADGIISYSSFGKLYYRSLGIKDEKIFVAVNVVDTDARLQQIQEFKTRTPDNVDDKDHFNIVFVGAMEPNKRVEVLIKALHQLSIESGNVHLHLVGDGVARPDLENLCMDLDVVDRVHFHGRVSGALAPKLCSMDVFVMPGLGGLAISDALCHGVPVLCGIGDGCEGDLVNGKNGMVLEDTEVDTLVKELRRLVDSPLLVSEMKKHAARTIDTYNINRYIDSISSAIKFVTAGK